MDDTRVYRVEVVRGRGMRGRSPVKMTRGKASVLTPPSTPRRPAGAGTEEEEDRGTGLLPSWSPNRSRSGSLPEGVPVRVVGAPL